MTLDASEATVTLAFDVAGAVDPRTDSSWKAGDTVAGAGISVDAQPPAFVAVMGNDGSGHLYAGVVDSSSSTPTVLCGGDATVVSPTSFQLSFPAGCVGSPSSYRFWGEIDVTDASSNVSFDSAPDSGLSGPVTPDPVGAVDGGGYVVDGWGGAHPFAVGGESARSVTAGPYWPGWDIVRGAAPAGGGLYVLDGWGGVHPAAVTDQSGPVKPTGTPYWKGWDIARGVAILPSGTGGYVLDGWGGLHPFGIGASPAPATPTDAAYWTGWDIARGVTILPDGSGGYVLDGWGGLHPFTIPGAGHTRPVAVSGGPYWPGWDIARGVGADQAGAGGYVLDGWGGTHPFGLGGHQPPAVTGGPYWRGWDIARGIAVAARVPIARRSGPMAASATLVDIPGRTARIVIDAASHFAYVTNYSANAVDVIDITTKALVAAIPVGSKPDGIDMTPDGTKLYVANSGGTNISVVDVATRAELRKINVPSQFDNDTPLSIAIANNGKAIFTTTFGGSGYGGRALRLDLATDAITPTNGGVGGQVTERAPVHASPDRSSIALVEGNTSGGETYLYSAATDTFTGPKELATFITSAEVASGAGPILVDGTYVVDKSLRLAGTIAGAPAPGALSPDGLLGYRLRDEGTATSVEVVDAVRFLPRGATPLPDYVSYYGRLAVAPDSTLVITSDHGVVVMPAPIPMPLPRAPSPTPSSTGLVTIPGVLTGIVADSAGTYAYASNQTTNCVDVINLSTKAAVAAIPVGSSPSSLDLSADGSKLYVANSGGTNVSVVDVASRTETGRLQIPSGFNNDRPYSIALSSDRAILTTTFNGSGYGGVRYSIDLSTGAATSLGSTTEAARVRASRDRTHIGWVEGDSSSGRIALYAATGTSPVATHNLNDSVYFIDVAPNGTKTLVEGTYVLDGSLNLLGTFAGEAGMDGKFGPGNTAYRVTGLSSGPATLDVLNTSTYLVTGTIALPDSMTRRGQLVVVGTTPTIAVLTDHGVSIVHG